MTRQPPAWVEYVTAAMIIVVLWVVALAMLVAPQPPQDEPQTAESSPAPVAAETAAEAPQMPEELDEQERITQALVEQGYFRDDVPLSYEMQDALHAICDNAGVEYALALGLIQHESGFDPEARNGVCYGLCQLNERYFPPGLTPEENMEAGISWLGELIARYGDTATALTVYNAGHDTGRRDYARVVMGYAEDWRRENGCYGIY